MITKEAVLESLKTVIDPELNINIVDLGLIYDVEIKEIPSTESNFIRLSSKRSPDSSEEPVRLLRDEIKMYYVEVTMTLTTPGCPLSMVFEEWVPAAVKQVDGVTQVMINLVWEPAWDPDKISDDMKETLGIIK